MIRTPIYRPNPSSVGIELCTIVEHTSQRLVPALEVPAVMRTHIDRRWPAPSILKSSASEVQLWTIDSAQNRAYVPESERFNSRRRGSL
jgi:hypothetical protein